MRIPELLAPAGSMEAVRAAVCNGATAVYLGFGAFNARRGAKNFTAEEMREALAYCRRHHVKTNVTVNTIVLDREMKQLLEDVRLLLEAGADALIVQDVGAARRIRERFPDAVLHASTQMTIHSLEGALAAKKLGFDRVVLSRELPLEEIKYITQHAGVETEVFVHGALCMCYSGQCGLSAVIGRRSGNRGLCAQPCRLPYGGKNQYPMSLKDLCLLPQLQALCEAGVSSLKIEGRMKRPEYVAIVTKIYASVLQEQRMPTKQELDTLERVFSRDGFTQGYLKDRIGPSMFGTRSKASEQELKPLYAAAAKTYTQPEQLPTVPVTLSFTAHAQQLMQLSACAQGHTVTVIGEVPEYAQKRATTREDVEKALQKTGGTQFEVQQLSIVLEDGLRIAAKLLNELRRQALEQLSEKVQPEAAPALRENLQRQEICSAETPLRGYTVQVRTMEQLSALTALPVQAYYVPLDVLTAHAAQTQKLLQNGLVIIPVLPRIIWDREQQNIMEQLECCKTWGCTQVLCGNIAQIALAQQVGLQPIGDFGLNAFNSDALETYRQMGVFRQTISFELRLPQIRDLVKPMETELIICGRLPLMLTENCMMTGAKGGCKRDGTGICAKGAYYLTDRRGAKFPVFREEHCRNTLYNSQRLYLEPEEYQRLGIAYARLLFTDETPQQAAEITAAVIQHKQPPLEDTTRGLYRRGVE